MSEDYDIEALFAKAEKQADLAALQAKEDLRSVLASAAGRATMWGILSKCGIYTSTFRGADTHNSAWAEGKRAIGLTLIAGIFDADPNAYERMRHEHLTRIQGD